MSEFKHQNPCQYADALIAYLYEETGGKDKSVFENHLADCSICADELAKFSAVRFSIGEWRETEFERLATPVVFIPELARNSPPIAPVEILETPSLLAQIRAFLGLSPARIGALAAALVVCASLILTVSYFRNEPQMARKEDKTAADTVSETNASLENRTAETAETIKDFEESKPPPTASEKTGTQDTKPILINSLPMKESKNPQTKAQRKIKKQPAKPALNKTKSPSPTLIADEDDYEDNSLRLSDLFREVGGG